MDLGTVAVLLQNSTNVQTPRTQPRLQICCKSLFKLRRLGLFCVGGGGMLYIKIDMEVKQDRSRNVNIFNYITFFNSFLFLFDKSINIYFSGREQQSEQQSAFQPGHVVGICWLTCSTNGKGCIYGVNSTPALKFDHQRQGLTSTPWTWTPLQFCYKSLFLCKS